MDRSPNILVCPLDWGIGHATRCVPIIQELKRQGARVIIGASERPLAFLKQEFPELDFINFPGHKVNYPVDGKGMVLEMTRQVPSLFKAIKKEHQILKKLIEEFKLDGVISDNRYGVYSKQIPSIFMTHQVFLKTPSHLRFLEPAMLRLNFKYINRFSEYWIPDFEGKPNLSGDLAHKKTPRGNYYFIGPLSRFSNIQKNNSEDLLADKVEFDVLLMLSGPEPQRNILENKITEQFSQSRLRTAIVQGKPENMNNHSTSDNPEIFSHLDTTSLYKLMMKSKVIISRSGYSTLMDLVALNKQAVFIPTPGQTEQEYLAQYHEEKGRFGNMSQQNFNLEKALAKIQDYQGLQVEFDPRALRKRINYFLEKAVSVKQ